MTELSSNINVPDKIFEDPIIKGLEDAANDIICFVNVVKTLNLNSTSPYHSWLTDKSCRKSLVSTENRPME